MITDINSAWRNAQKPILQSHLISWQLLECFDSKASMLLSSLSQEQRSMETINVVWGIRKTINLTMLDFDDKDLELDHLVDNLNETSGGDAVDSFLLALERLLEHPVNPKRRLFMHLLSTNEISGSILLWPRPAGAHPIGWPTDAVNRKLEKDFPVEYPSRLRWVNYLKEDMPEAVDSVVIWNPIQWEGRNVPTEHKLMRPLRRGLAESTSIFAYCTQGPPQVRFAIEMNRLGVRVHHGIVRPLELPISRWVWHEGDGRIEQISEPSEPDAETGRQPSGSTVAMNDEPSDEDLHDAICIRTSGGGNIHVATREVVMSDGALGEADDLRAGDLVAIPERFGGPEESDRLHRARVANAQWKKALIHAIEEGGAGLLIQGVRAHGVHGVHPWNLRSWCGTDVLAPRDKGTFFVLLSVLNDLVSVDFSIPSDDERERLWSQILRTRNTQRMEGRKRAVEDLEALREHLQASPALEPGLIELEAGRWRMRVVLVDSIEFRSIPESRLNRYEEGPDGKTDT